MKLKPLILCMSLVPAIALASSHREAPFIAQMPTLDASDFYMFMSYEEGRDGYVTLLANYVPLQDPGNGPNFEYLNENAAYDINIDNNGDAMPDMTFRFQFKNEYKGLAVPAGTSTTAVPLLNLGPITADDLSALNRTETYTVSLRTGTPHGNNGHGNANGRWDPMTGSDGAAVFTKPVSNIGNKSFADYQAYASTYMYDVTIPGCDQMGRVFAGQRKEGFVVNIGELFDLVNLNPVGPRDAKPNGLHSKNVTTLALEVPAQCLTGSGADPVIGAWTTASLPAIRVLKSSMFPAFGEADSPVFSLGRYTQVSRLGMPLVNEVVIGLPDKNLFNNSQPSGDAQFLNYVTNPSLPVILNLLFGDAAKAPDTPRNDLVAVFLTGVAGLNQPEGVVPSEMLRLNTSIPATPPAEQNDLGVLGGDLAGFPNGRRPYDDVVDIELRVVEGALCSEATSCGEQTSDPNGGKPYTDQTRAVAAAMSVYDGDNDSGADDGNTDNSNIVDTYLDQFPYLMPPIPGSPDGVNGLPTFVDGSAAP